MLAYVHTYVQIHGENIIPRAPSLFIASSASLRRLTSISSQEATVFPLRRTSSSSSLANSRTDLRCLTCRIVEP